MIEFIKQILSTALVTTTLIGAVAWLLRTVIYERLKARVQHEFDGKLEAIKAEFKAQDTRLQAEFRAKDQQLQLLLGGVLSSRASRQAALDTRRLDAIDALWAAFHRLGPYRTAARMMEKIKYETALDRAAVDPNVRAFFMDIAKFASVDSEKLKLLGEPSAWKSRLYVTDEAWKLFEAYNGVLTLIILRLKQLESGSPKDFTMVEKTVAEVKAALPHQTRFLEAHGGDGLTFIVDELGEAFERELISMLRNEPRSAADLAEAKVLMAAAEKLVTEPAAAPTA